MFPPLDGQSYKHMLGPTATLSLLPSSLFCLEYVPQKLPTLTGVGGIHCWSCLLSLCFLFTLQSIHMFRFIHSPLPGDVELTLCENKQSELPARKTRNLYNKKISLCADKIRKWSYFQLLFWQVMLCNPGSLGAHCVGVGHTEICLSLPPKSWDVGG